VIDDPIVEEIYQARQKILDQCNGDLSKWLERLKAAEARHPERIVTLEQLREKRQLDESYPRP
jgi:hypothetical protein